MLALYLFTGLAGTVNEYIAFSTDYLITLYIALLITFYYKKDRNNPEIYKKFRLSILIGFLPLLNLGIPGSPPAAMLLGALMLHLVTPGPMSTFDHPTFILEVAAILLLASMAMWVTGMILFIIIVLTVLSQFGWYKRHSIN